MSDTSAARLVWVFPTKEIAHSFRMFFVNQGYLDYLSLSPEQSKEWLEGNFSLEHRFQFLSIAEACGGADTPVK